MSKKSQSISINTIIIAAIALAVLVVLFVIFTGRMGIFTQGIKGTAPTCLKACTTAGYTDGNSVLAGTNKECAPDKFRISGEFQDVDPTQNICCCTR